MTAQTSALSARWDGGGMFCTSRLAGNVPSIQMQMSTEPAGTDHWFAFALREPGFSLLNSRYVQIRYCTDGAKITFCLFHSVLFIRFCKSFPLNPILSLYCLILPSFCQNSLVLCSRQPSHPLWLHSVSQLTRCFSFSWGIFQLLPCVLLPPWPLAQVLQKAHERQPIVDTCGGPGKLDMPRIRCQTLRDSRLR